MPRLAPALVSRFRRRRRAAVALGGFLAALIVAEGVSARDQVAPAATLGLEDIEAGSVGTARTVLAGTAIEEFDVEIVSIVHGTGPDQDMILAKGLGATIERLGVAQGMSGSPVYVGGKLIGAVSSTWSFASEPYLGITPVNQMAREAAFGFEARRAAIDPTSPRSPGVSASAGGGGAAVHWPGEADAAPLLAPPAAWTATGAPGFSPLGAPLVLSGFDPRVVELASGLFAPWGFTVAAGGGGGAGEVGGPLEPGATVGVRLAGGDVNMTALGAVTWIDGDRVHAFGHPLFQLGEVEMPIVTGLIHAVIPSRMISFKLGSGAEVVGTLTDDRRSGVFGRLGVVPHLTRFELAIARPGETERYGFDLVRHPALSSTLVGLTAANAVLARGGTFGEETVRYVQRVVLDDGRETTVRTLFAGDRTISQVTRALSDVASAIVTNPFETVAIDRIEAELTYEPGLHAAVLTEIAIDDDTPRPGDTILGTYTLRDFRGDETRHRFSVPLAPDAREGRYLLLLADAPTARLYESERDPRSFAPRTLDEYLERLATLRQPDDLHIHLYRSSPGVLIDGRPLPDLPPSVISVMRGSARSGVEEDLPAEIVHESRVPIGRFLQGGHSLLFEVRKDRP